MGKCLSKLPASPPKANNSSVPDVHQSSERSLKQLFDKEQQQDVGTTEELTAILEEDVCSEGQRYCIVETDEIQAEDGLFWSVDSIDSKTASQKELAQNEDTQETGPRARTSTEENFLSPSQAFQHVLEVPNFECLPEQKNHKEPLELQQSGEQEVHGQRIEAESHNERLECEREGYKEPVEAEKESQKEQFEAKEESHSALGWPFTERAAEGRPTGAEPVETEEESHNGQHHAAEGTLTDGRFAEQKESEESHEGWDSTQISQVTEGAPVSQAQQCPQDAGVQTRADANHVRPEATEADANHVRPEANNEVVNVQSVAEPSESNKPIADGGNMLTSAHVEATEAEETTGTAAITQVPSNSAADVDQQPSPPHADFVVSEASTVEATEAAAADNIAEEQHPREDCVPGEAAADQPEPGSSSESNKSAADARADGRYQGEHPTRGETTTAAGNKVEEQHDHESAPSGSAAELVDYPTGGEVASAAERKVEEQHDQLESGPSESAADAGNELVAEHPTSGEATSAAELGPSEVAKDAGNEMVAERETTRAAENNVEEQHGQRPSEFAAVVPTGGEATNAAENNVEGLHDKLESGPLESAPDAATVLGEQPTSDKTTTGSTSESMEAAGNVEQKPQVVVHEVSVENPEEPAQLVRSDDSTVPEQAAEEAEKGEQEPRLQVSETTDRPSAEAGNRDLKDLMESSGTFETFIDAQEQFADKRGDSDEEGP